MVAVLPGLAATVPAADAANRYDISYLWLRSLPGVWEYRDQVAGVLGPEVAVRLKVVAGDGLFGLVYVRHGGHASAIRVAKLHSRLLLSRGLEAASMVKLFIAAAFFCKVEDGELFYGSNSRRHMERSIQHSNNAATNWLLRKIGGPKAAGRILKRYYPSIFQDTHIVEYIPRGGRTYRNKASPHDYSRFLYAVWNGDIFGAREIKRLMALPGPDRLLTGVSSIPTTTLVYNKTGSTAHVCGDVGILIAKGHDGRRYPYTVIGIIEKKKRVRDYASWIRSRGRVIRSVSGIIYQGIKELHDF